MGQTSTTASGLLCVNPVVTGPTPKEEQIHQKLPPQPTQKDGNTSRGQALASAKLTATSNTTARMRRYLHRYGDAYFPGGPVHDFIPAVTCRNSIAPHNPDPKIFTRRWIRWRRRWIARNPNPDLYCWGPHKTVDKAGKTSTAWGWCRYKPEQASFMARELTWRGENSICGASGEPGSVPVKAAGGVLGVVRFRVGLRDFREGRRTGDTRRALEGLNHMTLGVSGVVPPLLPLGLVAWLCCPLYDLKHAINAKEFSGELNALGWAGVAGGWLLPAIVGGATAASVGTAAGAVGASLLLLKDVIGHFRGHAQGDKAQSFRSLCLLGLNAGLLALHLGAMSTGSFLILGGLVPFHLYGYNHAIRKKVDQVMKGFERRVTAPLLRLGRTLARPLRRPGRWLRDKVIRPAERKVMGMITKPVAAAWKFLHLDRATKYVLDALDRKVLEKIDHRLETADRASYRALHHVAPYMLDPRTTDHPQPRKIPDPNPGIHGGALTK